MVTFRIPIQININPESIKLSLIIINNLILNLIMTFMKEGFNIIGMGLVNSTIKGIIMRLIHQISSIHQMRLIQLN